MTRRAWVALALDAAGVLIFVAIGRRSHDETGNAIAGAARVASPFLIGLALGWLVARAWRRPLDLVTGAWIWAVTVPLGLVLRRTVFDRGVAAAFVIVATLTLALLLLGWRLLAARISVARPKSSEPARR